MHEFVVGLNQENLANAAAVEDRMGTEVWTEQRGFSFFHLFYWKQGLRPLVPSPFSAPSLLAEIRDTKLVH